jgi:uncharacterized protein (TIGR02271 family)
MSTNNGEGASERAFWVNRQFEAASPASEHQPGADQPANAEAWGAFRVEQLPVEGTTSRRVYHAEIEHVAPDENDDGRMRTLEDGSYSIPVFEEQLVVTKRTVVRERVLVRQRPIVEDVAISDHVRREHFEIEQAEPPAPPARTASPSEPAPAPQPLHAAARREGQTRWPVRPSPGSARRQSAEGARPGQAARSADPRPFPGTRADRERRRSAH